MSNNNQKFDLQKTTREVFASRTDRNLSNEDMREITQNLTGFFELLQEWSNKEKSVAKKN